MSEEQNTARDKIYKIDNILDEYEKKSGLSPCKPPGNEDELQKYLSMDRAELESIQQEKCAEIAYRLNQFGFYIQRLYNREKTRIIWAQQELTNTIAKSVNDYGQFTKHDVKVALIIRENTYAANLQKIIVYAEQRAQRLEFLATSIKYLADGMRDIRMARCQLARG